VVVLLYFALCGFWLSVPKLAPTLGESVGFLLLLSGPPSMVIYVYGTPVPGHSTSLLLLFAGSSVAWGACVWGAARTRRKGLRLLLGGLATAIWLAAGTCTVAASA
jgi:hypothetical protein